MDPRTTEPTQAEIDRQEAEPAGPSVLEVMVGTIASRPGRPRFHPRPSVLGRPILVRLPVALSSRVPRAGAHGRAAPGA